jgi:hypothetical protein
MRRVAPRWSRAQREDADARLAAIGDARLVLSETRAVEPLERTARWLQSEQPEPFHTMA